LLACLSHAPVQAIGPFPQRHPVAVLVLVVFAPLVHGILEYGFGVFSAVVPME
jgi:hypothetical protein